MERKYFTYRMSNDGEKTWTEHSVSYINHSIIEAGDLIQSALTELRGFESRFSTKVESVRGYKQNDPVVDNQLSFFLPKLAKIDMDIYINDSERTELYPLPIQYHMYFLKCNKEIPNYEDFILTNLALSKKGFQVSEGKLSNQSFVEKAPFEVIDIERKKLADFGFKWDLWTKAFLMYK